MIKGQNTARSIYPLFIFNTTGMGMQIKFTYGTLHNWSGNRFLPDFPMFHITSTFWTHYFYHNYRQLNRR